MASLDDFLTEADTNMAALKAAWESLSNPEKIKAGLILRRAFSSISEMFPEPTEENNG